MRITRRIPAMALAGVAALALWHANAGAQEFPSEPITIVVNWPAGGGQDTSARLIRRMGVAPHRRPGSSSPTSPGPVAPMASVTPRRRKPTATTVGHHGLEHRGPAVPEPECDAAGRDRSAGVLRTRSGRAGGAGGYRHHLGAGIPRPAPGRARLDRQRQRRAGRLQLHRGRADREQLRRRDDQGAVPGLRPHGRRHHGGRGAVGHPAGPPARRPAQGRRHRHPGRRRRGAATSWSRTSRPSRNRASTSLPATGARCSCRSASRTTGRPISRTCSTRPWPTPPSRRQRPRPASSSRRCGRKRPPSTSPTTTRRSIRCCSTPTWSRHGKRSDAGAGERLHPSPRLRPSPASVNRVRDRHVAQGCEQHRRAGRPGGGHRREPDCRRDVLPRLGGGRLGFGRRQPHAVQRSLCRARPRPVVDAAGRAVDRHRRRPLDSGRRPGETGSPLPRGEPRGAVSGVRHAPAARHRRRRCWRRCWSIRR